MSQLPLRARPATLPPANGYSHLAEARGRLIYIAGQVAETPDGTLIGKDDFGAQVEQVFRNLDIAVREAGAKFTDVVKLNYYCVSSVDRSLLPQLRVARDRYVDNTGPPASTFGFVAGLVRAAWLIEVEAIVALP